MTFATLEMFLKMALIILFCLLLAKSARIAIYALKRIAQKIGVAKFAVANLLLALGTTLPELTVSIDSSLKKNSGLVIGNILGSNIANLSLIIGGATLIAGTLKAKDDFLNHEIYYSFLVTAAPLFFLLDYKLTRAEGVILLFIYLLWQRNTFRNGAIRGKGIFQKINLSSLKKKIKKQSSSLRTLWRLIAAAIIMLISTEAVVKLAQDLTLALGAPTLIIGIFIVGVGTSLPELTLALQSLRKRECEIALGDLIGSLVANSSLILGIAAIIHPIQITSRYFYFATNIFYLLIFFLFYLFIKSKKTLSRLEGGILILTYFLIAIIELSLSKQNIFY